MTMRQKQSQATKSRALDFIFPYSAYLAATLLGCLLCSVQFVSANPEIINKKNATDLESLRIRIKDVESNIKAARNETELILNELQANEIAAANVSSKFQEIDNQIGAKVIRLAKLKVEKSTLEKSLVTERKHLAQQFRAAYKIGKNDYLKLLLNQEDPELIGRMLAYYDYYNRARLLRINKVTYSLENIARLEQSIQSETTQLDNLGAEQLAKLEEFTLHRISRNIIISRYHSYIEEQGEQLQTLQINEQELASLVNKLPTQETIVKIFEEIPPFNILKGKLNWPVQGQITNRFGALRKGGKLKWQGVTISTDRGTEVTAITTGKVIFADWFRNMGLLIILDHGDGYMSLYGHNERLLNKVGDWVQAKEIIAKVGDTGGQQQAGLYFEIRHSGTPVNPGLWCKI